MVRTRALAQDLVASRHVRVNGARIDQPGRPVRIGDILTIALEGHVRVLKVTGFAERRGGAPDAAHLFEELGTARPRDTP